MRCWPNGRIGDYGLSLVDGLGRRHGRRDTGRYPGTNKARFGSLQVGRVVPRKSRMLRGCISSVLGFVSPWGRTTKAKNQVPGSSAEPAQANVDYRQLPLHRIG